MPINIALMLSVCEGEQEMALDAAVSFARAVDGHHLSVFLIDDASKSDVAQTVTEALQRLGIETKSHRLELPLGFRGCARRTVYGLDMIAELGPYDMVVKMDPDTLVLRKEVGHVLTTRCIRQTGVHGFRRSMEWHHRLILLADLLPFGLRRRKDDGVMQRSVEFRRARPVWWGRWGWRAIRCGFRFQFCGGGFYAIHGHTLERIASHGWLKDAMCGEDGLVGSEEDVMVAILAKAAGEDVHEFQMDGLPRGTLKLGAEQTGQSIVDNGYCIVHPLKGKEHDVERRTYLRSACGFDTATAPVLAPP